MRIKKNDVILILIVLAVAAACFLLYIKLGRKDAGKVTVTVNGQLMDTYSLDDNTEVEVNGTNTFVIENREVKMKEADCPDQICVHQKAISKNKESIICLPNKVVIEIVDAKEAELDAVTN